MPISCRTTEQTWCWMKRKPLIPRPAILWPQTSLTFTSKASLSRNDRGLSDATDLSFTKPHRLGSRETAQVCSGTAGLLCKNPVSSEISNSNTVSPKWTEKFAMELKYSSTFKDWLLLKKGRGKKKYLRQGRALGARGNTYLQPSARQSPWAGWVSLSYMDGPALTPPIS